MTFGCFLSRDSLCKCQADKYRRKKYLRIGTAITTCLVQGDFYCLWFHRPRASKMLTLKEYIAKKVPGFDEALFLEYGSGAYVGQLLSIISNIQLQPEKLNDKPLPALLVSKAAFCYHNECIDLLIEFIIDKKIDNILKLGYTDGSASNSTSSYVFKGYNSTVELLKSKPMEIIRTMIGIEQFLELILHYTAIWYPSNQVLWGRYEKKSYKKSKCPRSVSFRSMLYVHTSVLHKTNPIIADPWRLLSYIFRNEGLDFRKRNDPPRRFRKVFKLIKLLILNHNSHMKEYPYMVEQICNGQKTDGNNNYFFSTPKSKVIEFIMAIIYKIIPLEFFGTSRNRSLIMRTIPRLINSTVVTRFALQEVVHKVKMNEISWIKPRADNTLTRPEFVRAKQMFFSFLSWLFQVFICKLTAAFFYVTQGSQQNRLLFFRHHIWNKMTRKYLSKYVTNHLVNLKDTKNSFINYSENKDFIGNLSLQPKKVGFRLIVKPFKGSWDRKVEYLTYQKRVLQPIMHILQKIRFQNSCNSVSEIIDRVYSYKKQLNIIYEGGLPVVYCYKFDAQNAYDSVPHDILFKAISDRLNAFSNNEIIYLQSFNEIDGSSLLRKRKNVVLDCLSDLSIFEKTNTDQGELRRNRKKKLVDNHETFQFTKTEILNLVVKQYKNTCFHTDSRSYYRKIGVYQGFPMSALLFNMVYDALVNDLYSRIGNDTETTIIRLMDDFLVLSTKKILISKMKKTTARSMKQYNLNINRLKTEFSTTEVSFAGLHIDVRNLVCYKLLADYNNAPIQASTFQKLYKILIRYTELRSKNVNLFNPATDRSGKEGCKKNVLALLKSIVFKFCNSYRFLKSREKFQISSFYHFIAKLFSLLTLKISLGEVDINFNKFWLYSLKILKRKRILQNNV